MKAADMHPFDQVFTHQDPEGNTRHFNASAIIRAILARKLTPHKQYLDLDQDLVTYIFNNHGVEAEHLKRIDDRLDVPILLAFFCEDIEDPRYPNVVIDGSHRIVRRWQKGLKTVPAICLKMSEWSPYLVEDMDTIIDMPAEQLIDYLLRKPTPV